jgi:hypothetical protein
MSVVKRTYGYARTRRERWKHRQGARSDLTSTRLTDRRSPRCAHRPGARAYYDQLRARGVDHHAALRQLGNSLVGILHGCLTTVTTYDEATAWAHQQRGSTSCCLTTELMGCLQG